MDSFDRIEDLLTFLAKGRCQLFTTPMDAQLHKHKRIVEVQRNGDRYTLHLSAHTLDGVRGVPSVDVSRDVWQCVRERLEDDMSDVRRRSDWPIKRTFVYVDISGFSQHLPAHQLFLLNGLLFLCEAHQAVLPEGTPEAQLCIGDGYIFVFRDSSTAVLFATKLADSIEATNAKKTGFELHFRMGIHTGEVLCFFDPGRDNWNYVGDAINGGARVVTAIGSDQDDVVFLSAQTRDDIRAHAAKSRATETLSNMQNRGRRKDKHGNWWRLYELDHVTVSRWEYES